MIKWGAKHPIILKGDDKMKDIWKWLVLAVIVSILAWYGLAYVDQKRTQDLESTTKTQMTADFNKNLNYQGIIPTNVSLIKDHDNKYTGFVDLQLGSYQQRVSLTVTTDGSNLIYQADPPTQLLTVIQGQIQQIAEAKAMNAGAQQMFTDNGQ